MGQLEPAGAHYEEAIGLLEPLVAGELDQDETRLALAMTQVDRGEHLRMGGRPRQAEPRYLKALDILDILDVEPDDDRYLRVEAQALIDLAASRVETGRPSTPSPRRGRPSRS